MIDGHSDLLWDVARRRSRGERHVLERYHLPQMRQGGIEGAVFALWADHRGVWSPATATCALLSAMRAELAEGGPVRLVTTAGEAETARRAGEFWFLLAAEGMDAIGDAGRAGVDWYYAHGVRWGMLTWNGANALATGAGGDRLAGLTAAGRAAVRRMEELGMVVDVSHLNDGGFREVLRRVRHPVAASHSNCRRLCDVPRNLSDDQLRAIRDTGGVVGVNSCRDFLHPVRERQTLETLALHAAHMIDVMGVEHVGCGFDFCDYLGPGNEPAAGLSGPGEAGRLLERLGEMGLRPDELAKIGGGNWLRLLDRVVGK